MLKQITCEIFLQKQVVFHEGLNTIVGDNIASNSIGKSTMLMIVDFIFGGEDYIKKNHDVVEQLDHHEFRFSFIFNDEELFFIRSTNEYKYVSICNEKYDVIKTIKLNEYTNILQKKYEAEILDLSFRNIVGRYFRVYGKENLNEHKPIQYFEKETAQKSIIALLMLFDKYKIIKGYEKQINDFTEERKVLIDAVKKDLIPQVNKTSFVRNQKKIVELGNELEKMKADIINVSANIESLISKEILELQKEKSVLITQRNMCESRLVRTQMNLKNKNIIIKPELEQLINYFPDFNVSLVEQIEDFHKGITIILKEELKEIEKEIKSKISDITKQIIVLDKTIGDKLNIKNAPKFAIDKIVELAAQIKQLTEENGFYTKKQGLDETIKNASEDLEIIKEKILDEMCGQINTIMYEINKKVYLDGRRAPTLTIHGERYTFNTYGDTGTGTAFANLITFDLSLLRLTCLPAIAHDLPLLKNIENAALENIIEIYCQSKKQIFIAIDKLNSYKVETAKLVEAHKVLQLSKDKLLFIKNWKKEIIKEAVIQEEDNTKEEDKE